MVQCPFCLKKFESDRNNIIKSMRRELLFNMLSFEPQRTSLLLKKLRKVRKFHCVHLRTVSRDLEVLKIEGFVSIERVMGNKGNYNLIRLNKVKEIIPRKQRRK